MTEITEQFDDKDGNTISISFNTEARLPRLTLVVKHNTDDETVHEFDVNATHGILNFFDVCNIVIR